MVCAFLRVTTDLLMCALQMKFGQRNPPHPQRNTSFPSAYRQRTTCSTGKTPLRIPHGGLGK
jgi:hypothetical protein